MCESFIAKAIHLFTTVYNPLCRLELNETSERIERKRPGGGGWEGGTPHVLHVCSTCAPPGSGWRMVAREHRICGTQCGVNLRGTLSSHVVMKKGCSLKGTSHSDFMGLDIGGQTHADFVDTMQTMQTFQTFQDH
jgi:hypothetical protein